jgi:soluble lytic murein transglycosylase-like protein
LVRAKPSIILKNKQMRSCFKLAGLALAACWAAEAAPPVRQASLVVRADRHTGRLVRTVVVSAPVVPQVVVRPRVVAPVVPSRRLAAPRETDLEKYIDQIARHYEVDPLLVHSLIQVESNYNPLALSPKGARGVMQLMPGTARRFEVANSWDPFENIDGGVRYLRYLLGLFSSERLALAAYNAGEGAVFRYGNVPPYPETIRYVRQVGRKYGAARQAAQQAEIRRADVSPAHPSIRQYTDAHGKVHYETRSGP